MDHSNSYTSDTSAEAYQVQLDCLRRLSPQERVNKAFRLSSQLRDMAFDAIRRIHPEYDEDQVQLEFIRVTYGKELARDFANWRGAKR